MGYEARIKPEEGVRVRRAYFDCRFGQLHVRTGFSSTGGFDEKTTLLCVHPRDASGKVFDGVLPLISADRSVYAPDLPGCGESDPPDRKATAAYAAALSDLIETLRIRKIDVVSYGDGAAIVTELGKIAPELIRTRLELNGGETRLLTTDPAAVERRIREFF